MAVFLEERLDTRITQGAQGGPTVPGRTKTYLPNGRLQQNFLATMPIHRFDILLDTLSREDFLAVQSLWYVVMFAPYVGFRFKHWGDFQATRENSTLTAVAGGGWQLQRKYAIGSYTFLRDIQKPCASPAAVFYDAGGNVLTGTVDTTTGIATITGTPASWVGEFDVPVTFTDDEWMGSIRGNSRETYIQSGQVKLEEIRVVAGSSTAPLSRAPAPLLLSPAPTPVSSPAPAPAPTPPAPSPAPSPSAAPVPAPAPSPSVTGVSYYVDPISGNDANAGTSSGAAWQTLGRVNTAGVNFMQPGDGIFFKKGQTYTGTLRVEAQGTPTSPILIGAYGSGAKPVLSGFATITGWTSLGSGIWEANCAAGTSLSAVSVNGAFTPRGRFPKAAAANGGWLTIASHSGTASLTDNTYTHTQNWVGGEMVVRGTQYLIDRSTITNQSSGTFTLSGGRSMRDGFGYFIQGHAKTLEMPSTTVGEWHYNPTTHKIRMYFGGDDPTTYTVKASVTGTLVNFSNLTNYVIDGLALEGAGTAAIDLSSTSNMTVQNCDISHSGRDAIFGQTAAGLTVQANTITDSASDAISFNALTNGTIVGNSIDRTGMHAGAGGSGDGTYNAISLGSSSHTRVAYNYINHTGYIGISFMGDHFTVENNIVLNSCQVKDDGGGIYTYYNNSFTTPQNQYSYVRNNIVIGGPGNSYGTSNLAYFPAFGIYLDNASAFVFVQDNTVSGYANGGIFVNSSCRDNTLSGNTLYNNGMGVVSLSWYAPEVVRRTTITSNVIVSKAATLATSDAVVAKSSQPCLYIKSAAYNDWPLIGTWSGNWYSSPYPNEAVDLYSAVGGNTAYSLAGWKTLSTSDTGSTMAGPFTQYQFEYATFESRDVVLSGTWADAKGASFSGTITLAPFTSVVLLR